LLLLPTNKEILSAGQLQGVLDLKGSRKSTPFAAQIAADKAGNAAKEFGMIKP
jgi:ribosomal protein S11